MKRDIINELKKHIGKEVRFDFTKSGIIGSGVQGEIKKVFDDGFVKLVNCSTGMDIQIINLRQVNIIEIENRR